MSTPTISRSIKRLEDKLAAKLLIMSNRGVTLTGSGSELAHAISELDYKMHQIANSLQRDRRSISGIVRLSVTEGIASIFIAPVIEEFTDRYPGIRLVINAPVNVRQVRENLADILVTYAPHPANDLIVRELGTVSLIPVAAHNYIKRYGIPTAQNLKSHRFLDCDAYMNELPLWRAWREATDRGQLLHTCESSFAYGLLVRSGVGIGLLGNYVLAEESFVPIDLGFFVPVPLYLIALAEQLQARPVAIVYDWLSEILGPGSRWLARTDNPHLIPDLGTQQLFRRLVAPVASAVR